MLCKLYSSKLFIDDGSTYKYPTRPLHRSNTLFFDDRRRRRNRLRFGGSLSSTKCGPHGVLGLAPTSSALIGDR